MRTSLHQLMPNFGRNLPLHLKNIYKDNELDELSTTEDFSVVRKEGERQVKRNINHYNLDVVISVGYRVNSKKATQFHQWATKTLKQHLLAGYTLNEKCLAENATELQKALELVTRAAALPQHSEMGAGLVDIIAKYTNTFLCGFGYNNTMRDVNKCRLQESAASVIFPHEKN